MKVYRWVCVTACYQRVFGSEDPNKMRRYSPDELHANEGFVDEQYLDQVPKEYFDVFLVEDDGVVEEAPPDPDVIVRPNTEDAEAKPVETLYTMSVRRVDGLHDEGIYTIGDLRECLASPKGIKRLLESDNCDIGPATIRKFQECLDANLTIEKET